MNDEPTAQTPAGEPDPPPQDPGPQEPAARRLTRPRDERVIAGVCSGIARYFSIDPVITRIAAVGLVFLGGVGVVLYLAAWLLVPEEGAEPGAAPRLSRGAVIGGAILLFIALAVGAEHLFWWPGAIGGPLVFIALAGAAVWWLVRGRRGGGAANTAGRVLMVAAVLVLSVAAVGAGFWAAGLGGGAAVAGLLVVAGLGIMAAAFAGGARWLIAPAIALAVGTGVATAADVDLRGDYGERTETPRSRADLPTSYDMGAGSLVVDLRTVDFGAGPTPLRVEVGIGEAVILVPPDLCVVTEARIGVGELVVLGSERDGVDIDRRDTALPDAERYLALDAEIGMGSLRVTTDPDDADRDDRWDRHDDDGDDDDGVAPTPVDASCIAGTRG